MFLHWLGDGIITFLIAMTPVVELRGAIPYAIVVLDMDIWSALLWSISGNIFVGIILMIFLDVVIKWLFLHSSFLTKHIKKYFEKLHTKHSMKFNELGAFFLAVFVAIPIPGTGVWTGALLAYIFNIPFWLAVGSLSLGVLGAGAIVAFFSESAVYIISLIG